ncbi:MAG: peptidoglycan editing factor PgeF [Candidatus Zixiibacteriota bacterium]|nr:MAG: peptidoglycan editing factor PgeF [candidate division Zixibacteria bacterium]
MFKEYEKSVKLWHFENLSEFGNIVHFVSTRKGGYSAAPYDSFNLALSSGDNPLRVIQNRELLASVLGFTADSILTSWQAHGDRVRIITKQSIESDASHQRIPKEAADAMITNVPNICLMNLTADCAPVLCFDPEEKVIGIAHAGWRGTVKAVTANLINSFKEKLGCLPENIIAGIGPSIGPCCYEVGPEVIEEVEKNLGEGLISEVSSDGKGYFDLREANRRQLIETGVSEKNIEIADKCTHCYPDLFFSYRHHGKKSGRIGAGIMLRSL